MAQSDLECTPRVDKAGLRICCPGRTLLLLSGCAHRKKIDISSVLAGQRLDIREVNDGIWLVSFMAYDLGYIDLEQKTLQLIDNPFGSRPHDLGTYELLPTSPGWTH